MMNANGRITHRGSPLYLHGANYPWMVVEGKSNYGLDFGFNVWGSHRGVSAFRDDVDRDFHAMSRLGFNTVRWFVFTDGRGGIRYDDRLMPVAPSEKCLDDLRCAADIAAMHGIRLILVLFDFLLLFDLNPHHRESKARMFLNSDGRGMLLDNVLRPVITELAHHPGILAWEVMNEPDWVIKELDPNRKEVSSPVPLATFMEFVRSTSDLVHVQSDALVTVGGGRIKFMHVWDGDEYGIDFIQVHTYNDFLQERFDEKLFGRSYTQLGLKRPLLIGEYATRAGEMHPGLLEARSAIALKEYLNFAIENDYAGALYWSYKDVDKCRSEDPVALLEWKSESGLA